MLRKELATYLPPLAGGSAHEALLSEVDCQAQAAREVVGLVEMLKDSLEGYLAIRAGLSSDESSRIDTAEAGEWMQRTIDDLVATIVGIEATPT
ncbi:hypothetical protein MB46_02715 [Arthrobacter alpinus]|uniref:hypothetical protein n=1 Tax=Arthrobacter alpinus TaxID=656366 RepID=UPI0005CAB714|nr:hypothetical protein [Arthrobacter alpinus]ALV44593.1 hypothetical protein MB46_02715 [Arthrobacter alpinus]